MARETWPCSEETAFVRCDIFSARTVMQKSSPWLCGSTRPRRQQRLRREPQRIADRAEMLFDEAGREAIVPGGNGRVRGEDDLRGHAAHGLLGIDALRFHPAPDELERGKGTVPLIEMHHARRDPERVQRANPADAEQQLLADPDTLIAAVQPGRQLPILRAVAVHVRVEEQEGASADRDAPDPSHQAAGPGLDLHRHRHAVVRRRLDRQQVVIDVDVVLLLPAVGVEALPEVALVVVQADADERDAEVGRALHVVAGQDPEAARIDRHRLVQSEFRREVRHRARAEDAGMTAAPRVLRPEILLQPAVRLVDATVERQLRHPQLELIARNTVQQLDGIVVARGPEHRIEVAEQADALVVPAPPEIARERRQPLVHGRDELPDGARLLMIGESCTPAAASSLTSSSSKSRGCAVCSTSTPCRTPRSMTGTPRKVLYGSSPASWKYLNRGWVLVSRTTTGTELLGHQAGEPLRRVHPDAADALRTQTDGRGEDEIGAVSFEHDRPSRRPWRTPLNEVDDVGERFGGVAAASHELRQFLVGPQAQELFVTCRQQPSRTPMASHVASLPSLHTRS